MFWANISRNTEEKVKGRTPCQHHQNMNIKEPLVPHNIPQKPWHTLGSDLFFWNNASYLVISDYYWKVSKVRKLNNMKSNTTIAHLKSIFEEHGIPNKLITGNNTQFASAGFQDFSLKVFTHTTTSPYFSQTNGFLERKVQTIQNLFKKCKESGKDPHLAASQRIPAAGTPVCWNFGFSWQWIQKRRDPQFNLWSVGRVCHGTWRIIPTRCSKLCVWCLDRKLPNITGWGFYCFSYVAVTVTHIRYQGTSNSTKKNTNPRDAGHLSSCSKIVYIYNIS